MAQAKTSWGLLLPTREVVMAQGNPDLHKIIDLAAQAEALGFDSVWVGDSILARPRLEALTTLAAIASRTRRVRLGTAVLLSALRHPVLLANEVANLDILSSGRVTLGLGIATKHPTVEREFAACGIPLGQRIGIFEEGRGDHAAPLDRATHELHWTSFSVGRRDAGFASDPTGRHPTVAGGFS